MQVAAEKQPFAGRDHNKLMGEKDVFARLFERHSDNVCVCLLRVCVCFHKRRGEKGGGESEAVGGDCKGQRQSGIIVTDRAAPWRQRAALFVT